MKRKRLVNKVLYILILLLIFIVLVNPQLVPFLSPETQTQIASAVDSTFSAFADDGTSPFTLPKVFNMLAVTVLILLCSSLVRFFIDVSTLRGKRSRTVAGLILSVITYASVIAIVIWCLTIMGVNVTGIFASLGIVSLIIGFGAQSLIEDIITGIFIIFEGQYNVGDIIVLDDFRGTVRRIGVRTTCIEDAGGNLKIVNNSDIRNLQNRSENLSYALCDVGIPYGTRVEKVEKVLEEGLPKIGEKYAELFPNGLAYRGVQELGASAVVLRIIGQVREEEVYGAQRTMNREIKILFDDNDIEIPFQQIVLHSGDREKPETK